MKIKEAGTVKIEPNAKTGGPTIHDQNCAEVVLAQESSRLNVEVPTLRFPQNWSAQPVQNRYAAAIERQPFSRLASYSIGRSRDKAEKLRATAVASRVEKRLDQLLPPAEAYPQPLHRAMRHAVLAGGKRLRPRLLLAVFASCRPRARAAEDDLALQAACAIELIHAASLVHDDLPTFDDADERRGRPTVHKIFGEPIALLAGDGLLTLAFEVLACIDSSLAARALQIMRLFGRYTGSREGIIGGQSLESLGENCAPEPLARYHQMKTAALFQLAAEAGATAAGACNASRWAEVGKRIGLAYQLADDLYDVLGAPSAGGKPVGQDATHGRPNAVHSAGTAATKTRIHTLIAEALQMAESVAADPRPVAAFLSHALAEVVR
jgi:geranylgeranyl diphosphate synthase, type II